MSLDRLRAEMAGDYLPFLRGTGGENAGSYFQGLRSDCDGDLLRHFNLGTSVWLLGSRNSGAMRV